MMLASLIVAVLALAYVLEILGRSGRPALRSLVIHTDGTEGALGSLEFACGLVPLFLAGLGLPLLVRSWPLGLAALTVAGLLVLTGRLAVQRHCPQQARARRS